MSNRPFHPFTGWDGCKVWERLLCFFAYQHILAWVEMVEIKNETTETKNVSTINNVIRDSHLPAYISV